MSRVHLALNVADLEASVAFYSKLFGVEPAKRRPGYANFAITHPAAQARPHRGRAGPGDPPGPPRRRGRHHRGSHRRHRPAQGHRSWPPSEENDTACCYALQDKVWVHGPGKEPWEVYVAKADADVLEKPADSACCAPAGDSTEAATPACC